MVWFIVKQNLPNPPCQGVKYNDDNDNDNDDKDDYCCNSVNFKGQDLKISHGTRFRKNDDDNNNNDYEDYDNDHFFNVGPPDFAWK